MKRDTEAVHVQLNVKDKKYIKLVADKQDTGNDSDYWNDYSEYAAAKFTVKDYAEADSTIEVSSVSELDAYLNNNIDTGVHEDGSMDAEYEMKLLQRTFVNRYQEFFNNSYIVNKDVADAVNYIYNNKEVLQYFVDGGEIEWGSYATVISNWISIYKAHSTDFADASHGTTYLKIAVATSISHSHRISFWNGTGIASDPVIRYEKVKKNYDNGVYSTAGMSFGTANFDKLPIELMRWITNNQMNDADMDWLTWYAGPEKRKSLDAYTYIAYQWDMKWNYSDAKYYSAENQAYWNSKYGLDKFEDSNAIYGTSGVMRPYMVFEEGSVCGGLAKTYANLHQLYGFPSAGIGQPGHAATITCWVDSSGHYRWSIQNDISGWAGSEKGERMPLGWGTWSYHNWIQGYSVSYIHLSSAAFEDAEGLAKSSHLNYLASIQTDNNKKIELYKKAIAAQKINLDSWEGLIKAYRADSSKTSADYMEIAKGIADAYTYYPKAFNDFMTYLKTSISGSDVVDFEQLRYSTLKKATTATTANVVDNGACRTMANSIISKYKFQLASFSFDGDNAGKIVIGSEFANTEFQWKYSLDGGNTYTTTDAKTVELSADELASISAENDIIIQSMSGEWDYKIDITSNSINKNTSMYVNYNENKIYGISYSKIEMTTTDPATGDAEWVAYDGTKYNQTIYVRLKNTGTTLANVDYKEINFTENEYPAERTYVSIDHFTLDSFASEETSKADRKASYLMDGNANTLYHNSWSAKAGDEKYVIYKSDEKRLFTGLDYLNTAINGRINNLVVSVSDDGENWTVVHDGNLQAVSTLQEVTFSNPIAGTYIKIEAKSSYDYSGQENLFMSGNLLNIYADTRYVEGAEEEPAVEEVAEPVIEYKTISLGTIPLKYAYEFVGFSATESATEAEYTLNENGEVEVPIGTKLYSVWKSNRTNRYSAYNFTNDADLKTALEEQNIAVTFAEFNNLHFLYAIEVSASNDL